MTRTGAWISAAIWLGASGAAWAADDEGAWVGGFVSTGIQANDIGVGTILSQAELDARWANDILFARVDLDYHFDPFYFASDVPNVNDAYDLAPHYPYPPEFAMLQIGRERYHLRLGVTNPGMGMQAWDERDNYLPSYSIGWGLTNGQIAGAEPGIVFDDGTEIFAFGGYDMAWLTPTFGAGIDTEQDSWGTWSGFFYQPENDYFLLITADEYYPLDELWLSGEVLAGLVGSEPILGATLVADIYPEAVVSGAVRAEHQFTPDAEAIIYGAPLGVTEIAAAVKTDPIDYLHIGVEGRADWYAGSGDPSLGGTLLVSFGTLDPSDDFGVSTDE